MRKAIFGTYEAIVGGYVRMEKRELGSKEGDYMNGGGDCVLWGKCFEG